MMFKTDGNLQAAKAHHAHLCHAELEWAQAVRQYPPTCNVCEHGKVCPSEEWALCEDSGEWVEARGWDGLKCKTTDLFEPTCEREAYQLCW